MKRPEDDNPYRMPTASGPGPGSSDLSAAPEVTGYEILRVLNEGGMGVVYLARQMHPIRRRVALKVIKPGMDSRQVLARFEIERQALAVLDHPHIAQVHDAGATKDGRPYFAMEYVKGLPITHYCDREKLSIEARLELFKHVCEGVQHAHQKGIIHRDIKPSNILVHTEGDEAVVKIIDFGVAKAIGQPLTGRTLYTEAGQLVGTPEYMSPEQADMVAEDIDTRSDIYSLGAVLYELLTGVLPFDTETLREGGIEHIRQVIRDEDPKTPSVRFTSMGQRATVVAHNRCTQVGPLAKRLHKELEWIPLKAMRKERVRRYRSVAELADDIQHYLDGAPLIAGPESTLYLVKKFVARNRGLVAGIAAVVMVLMVGIAVTTFFAVRADYALAELRAVTGFLREDLLASVDQFVAEEPNVTVRSILDAGSNKLDGKYPNQPLVEAWIRQALGETYWRLGLYAPVIAQLERALDLFRDQHGLEHPVTLACMMDLGWVYFRQGYDEEAYGVLDHAEALFEEALEPARRVLGEKHPYTLVCMSNLGTLYKNRGRYDEAKKLYVGVLDMRRGELGTEHEDTLEAMNNLAALYIAQECYREAQSLCEEALKIGRRILAHEDTLRLALMNNLGVAYKGQEDYEMAEKLLLEAAEGALHHKDLGQSHAKTRKSINHLISVYEALGRPDEAEKWRAKGLKAVEQEQ